MAVYFMQPVGGGPIKIGHSVNVDLRRQRLESYYKTSLEVLATIDGGRETEREIHEQFAHLRFGRTEQFRPAPDLLAFIGRPLLVDINPDTVEAMPVDSELKTVRLELTVDEHKQLRVEAAKEGMSMAMFARKLVSDFLAKTRSKGKGKEKT